MSFATIPTPIEPQLPPTLNFLTIPIANYFSANPPYNNVVLEALIFTPPPQPPRILLLQRAGGGADPNAFSDYWQVPRGKPLVNDGTMLDSLARIVREQTGLQISFVATMCGTEEGPGTRQTGNVLWMRMLFMVEVAELAPRVRQTSEQPDDFALEEDSGYEPSETITERESVPDSVEVRIDPGKHRLHVWASEGDLKKFINARLYPAEERIQYQIMLEGFAYYRQDFAQLENLRQARQNTAFHQGLGS